MVAWIDASWPVHEITLWIHADNIASQRTAEHAGFRYQHDRDEMLPVGSQVWPVRWYQRPGRQHRDR
jgi:RimJ/RimL family protein N-acetyltransferase